MAEQTAVAENASVALVAQKPMIASRASLRETLEILKDTGLIDAMGRELVEREVAAALYDQDFRVARMFAQSGFFSDIKGEDPEQSIARAMTKLQLGRSWNMELADAIQHIYLVNGRPAVQNEYLASKMSDAGLQWEIDWSRDANDECTGCKLWPSRLSGTAPDGSAIYRPIMDRVNGKSVPASVAFTKAHADKIMVKEDNKWIKLSEKSTYQAYPEDMYFWRCIARLRRRYAPNVLSGVLTRSEAEDVSPVEIQRTLPAPEPKPMEIPQGLQASRAARGRAGNKDIPGTGTEEAGQRVERDAVPAAAGPTAPEQRKADAGPTPADAGQTQADAVKAVEPATTVQHDETSPYQRIIAIGKKRGESWFVRTLFEFNPKVTPETLGQVKPEGMAQILAHVLKADAEPSSPPPTTGGSSTKPLW